MMLSLIIQTLVLMVLIKVFVDEDASFWSSLLLTIVAGVVMGALGVAFVSFAGVILAIVLAGILVSIGLGFAISAMYGAPWSKSALVGVVYLVVSIGLSLGFQLLLS